MVRGREREEAQAYVAACCAVWRGARVAATAGGVPGGERQVARRLPSAPARSRRLFYGAMARFHTVRFETARGVVARLYVAAQRCGMVSVAARANGCQPAM